jgi:hypothetical protein
MARTSRKPRVVISAVRAPLRSSTALVATVEPWTTSSICQLVSSRPASTARDGSSGVEGRLYTDSFPSSHSKKSVKVPPTSTPRHALSGAGGLALGRSEGTEAISRVSIGSGTERC